MASAQGTQSSSPAPGAGTGTGGVWETVVDTAIGEVSKYLVSSVKSFDPDTPLAKNMLLLIDHASLRDILVERNYNRRCGCIGCGELPSGIKGPNSDALSFEWVSGRRQRGTGDDGGSGSSDSHEDEDEDAEETAVEGERTSAMVKSDLTDSAAATEEIVYEEDVFIAESFRLAQRQRAQLARLKAKMRRERQAVTAAPSLGHVSAVGRRILSDTTNTAMLGATMAERFCRPECADYYGNVIKPRVARVFMYDHPMLLQAIAGVFPNMRLDVLQRLASAEVADCIVGDVKESTAGATTSQQQQAPIQVGVSYETVQGKEGTSLAAEAAASYDAVPVSLREALEEAHVLQRVWDCAVVPRFHAHGGQPSTDAGVSMTGGSEEGGESAQLRRGKQHKQQHQTLKGPLLVMDFLMTVRGPRTPRVLLVHYAATRAGVQAAIALYQQKAISHGCDASSAAAAAFVANVLVPISAALEAKMSGVADLIQDASALLVSSSAGGGAVLPPPASVSALAQWVVGDKREAPGVSAVQQQPRRQLLASQLFSTDVSAVLGRLLMVDSGLLDTLAWNSVWLTVPALFTDLVHVYGKKDCVKGDKRDSGTDAHDVSVLSQLASLSLLSSLQIPFPIPGDLLRPAHGSPEVLELSLTLLVAAACVHKGVMAALLESADMVVEVMTALGFTEDDLLAAVRAIMFDEEDD